MGEHRRTKHRAGQEGGVQGLGLPPQNMGHNLGQYFSNKTLYKPAPAPAPAPAHHNHNVLPPFSIRNATMIRDSQVLAVGRAGDDGAQ